jgi:peroxin-6
MSKPFGLVKNDSMSQLKYTMADTSNVDEIARLCPCLLYIEGIDKVLSDVSALQSNQDLGTSPQSSFSRSLSIFFEDLNSKKSLVQGKSTNSAIELGLVLSVADVLSEESLEYTLKSNFPGSIKLEPYSSGEVDEEINKNIISIIKNTKDAEKSELKSMIHRIVSEHGSGMTSFRLLQMLISNAFTVDSRSDHWYTSVTLENIKKADRHFISTVHVKAAKNKMESLNMSKIKVGPGTGDSAKVSAVRWDDIGGMHRVRKEILDMIQLPFLRPELYPPGCPVRRAILLYGPPGTGKTLVARAVATECDMAFISVKGPELLDVYVGESEANVRALFLNAREQAPCVVFFDELDSLAPARGRGNDGGGVMDRVVAQLLTEMDDLSSAEFSSGNGNAPNKKSKGVFVLGATNRPDLLDSALLRPGRFDRKVYLPVCKEIESRKQILIAQTRKIKLDDSVDLDKIASLMPDTATGADVGAVVSSAYSHARAVKLTSLKKEACLHLKIEMDEIGEIREPSEDHTWQIARHINSLPAQQLNVSISYDDLVHCVRHMHLSVTAEDLFHYEKLAQQYDDDDII